MDGAEFSTAAIAGSDSRTETADGYPTINAEIVGGQDAIAMKSARENSSPIGRTSRLSPIGRRGDRTK